MSYYAFRFLLSTAVTSAQDQQTHTSYPRLFPFKRRYANDDNDKHAFLVFRAKPFCHKVPRFLMRIFARAHCVVAGLAARTINAADSSSGNQVRAYVSIRPAPFVGYVALDTRCGYPFSRG